MKILFFIGNLRSGGKERRLVELLKSLNKNHKDIELCLVLIRNTIQYEEVLNWNLQIKYFVEEVKSKNPFFIYRRLFNVVKNYKPNIIHSWGNEETFYIFSVAKLLNIKLINSQITDAPKKINWLSQFGIQTKINFLFSDAILANSHAGLKSYNAPKAKSSVIYNGFDFNRIKNLIPKNIIRRKFSIDTKNVIAMVATFSDKKDYNTYIKAALLILKKRKDITFLCIGSGDSNKYESMVTSEVKAFIKFIGRQSDVESIINICNCSVLSTNSDKHGEGISNSLMESMALGVPIIATEGGGTVELVINNETGFLVPSKSFKILANKIIELIDDEEKRLKMGIKSKDRIRKEFSIKKMISSFIDLYMQLKGS